MKSGYKSAWSLNRQHNVFRSRYELVYVQTTTNHLCFHLLPHLRFIAHYKSTEDLTSPSFRNTQTEKSGVRRRSGHFPKQPKLLDTSGLLVGKWITKGTVQRLAPKLTRNARNRIQPHAKHKHTHIRIHFWFWNQNENAIHEPKYIHTYSAIKVFHIDE